HPRAAPAGSIAGCFTGHAIALVPNFFVSCEEFLRSSLCPGWLELSIFDCRLPIDSSAIRRIAFSIDNRPSAIGNQIYLNASVGNAVFPYEDRDDRCRAGDFERVRFYNQCQQGRARDRSSGTGPARLQNCVLGVAEPSRCGGRCARDLSAFPTTAQTLGGDTRPASMAGDRGVA